jgi:hypothetical protein
VVGLWVWLLTQMALVVPANQPPRACEEAKKPDHEPTHETLRVLSNQLHFLLVTSCLQ